MLAGHVDWGCAGTAIHAHVPQQDVQAVEAASRKAQRALKHPALFPPTIYMSQLPCIAGGGGCLPQGGACAGARAARSRDRRKGGGRCREEAGEVSGLEQLGYWSAATVGGLWVVGTSEEVAAAAGKKLGLLLLCSPCLRSCARDNTPHWLPACRETKATVPALTAIRLKPVLQLNLCRTPFLCREKEKAVRGEERAKEREEREKQASGSGVFITTGL